MRRARQKGATMIIAIMALSLTAAAIVILTAAAESFSFDSDLAYANACSRNLLGSGLAWAQQHQREATHLESDRPLNVDELKCPRGELVISATPVSGSSQTVWIQARCQKGRATARQNGVISLIRH